MQPTLSLSQPLCKRTAIWSRQEPIFEGKTGLVNHVLHASSERMTKGQLAGTSAGLTTSRLFQHQQKKTLSPMPSTLNQTEQSHRQKIFGADKKQGCFQRWGGNAGRTCRASWQSGWCHAPPGLWAGCRSAAQRERGPGPPSSCPAGAAGGGRGGTPPPDSSDLQRMISGQQWGRRGGGSDHEWNSMCRRRPKRTSVHHSKKTRFSDAWLGKMEKGNSQKDCVNKEKIDTRKGHKHWITPTSHQKL